MEIFIIISIVLLILFIGLFIGFCKNHNPRDPDDPNKY